MTARYQFLFYKDLLAANTEIEPLPAANRVIYVASGTLSVEDKQLEAGEATFQSGAVNFGPRAENVELWRWDLVEIAPAGASPSSDEHRTKPVLTAPVEILEIEPGSEWFLRCETVNFPAETTVDMHAHHGAGIRCLELGEINFTHLDGMKNTVRPGDAWYEEAFHYLHALTMKTGPSRFVRVMLVPPEYNATSTFKYHNQDDAGKPRRQTTEKLVDVTLTL
ncbi:MAG: quercetin dioxygenase-like cupin family protein [Paracoccaceae bacterium]|jgi:quercetin dioxygenase-like cupin family protein